jgi:hypothetical protein
MMNYWERRSRNRQQAFYAAAKLFLLLTPKLKATRQPPPLCAQLHRRRLGTPNYDIGTNTIYCQG